MDVMLLREWEMYSRKQALMHNKMRATMRWRNYTLAIPAILLTTISGSANISLGAQNECGQRDHWLPIVFGSMGLMSAAMFSIHRYLTLPELQKEHDFYSDEFEKLSLEINMQLVLDQNNQSKTYRNIDEFIKECKKRLDVLIDKAPAISGRVAKEVERKWLHPEQFASIKQES